MKYLGSKNRIAKHILPIMLDAAQQYGITTWVEPFCGGGNMVDKVPDTFKRIGYDLNPHTIAAMTAIRDIPNLLPDNVTEAEYKALKGTEPDLITSLIRFGCSFGGKFENGYARDLQGTPPRNFAAELKRNSLKQSPKIQGVEFICDSYENLSFENCLIYCDSPYQGTTGYKTGTFDHDKFFEWCREMRVAGNIVFVSEYDAPFECVWRGEVKTNFASSRKNATHVAVEKLYLVQQNT